MIFKIAYLRGDVEIAASLWDDSKGDVHQRAKDGVVQHQATEAIVLDASGRLIEVHHS